VRYINKQNEKPIKYIDDSREWRGWATRDIKWADNNIEELEVKG
jgi:hypothetical protein